jgi:hypothetical protein
LSAIAGTVAASASSPTKWFLFGFEVVTLGAALFGGLLGAGRFGSAPGLGLLSVAGATGASAVLGFVGADQVLMGMSLKPFLLARLAAAGGFAAIAAIAVLIRRPGTSLPKLLAGLACAAGFVAAGFVAWKTSGLMGSLGVPVQAIMGLIGFSVLLGLLAASVHLLIAAFESCDVDHLGGGNGKP